MIAQYSQGNNTFKTRFAVFKGESITTVLSEEVAYFYTEDKVVFLVQHTGEKNSINYTLEQLERSLNPQQFFRINRQFIVSLKGIAKASNYFNYKLKVHLNPPAPTEVIVSSLKAAEFKQWMDGA